ncbi:DUF1573 domain-containing protein [Gabonibacter massiliensis]|uniref:DUF1573 domain-containing protein n=1 Tax=Gabonibacter massiliensis TaxID=1720195 RepID=UPI00073E4C5F|nr:DUF1573 domain-containing protein [Gabonibacter massiliensis]
MKKKYWFIIIVVSSIVVLFFLFSEDATFDKPKQQQTAIEVNRDSVYLDTFRYSESKKTIFEIKNTGHFPLIIKKIETSCGCTDVTWNKKPLLPGKTEKIQITFTPNSLGHFSKTIRIFCNISSQTYTLRLSGFVKE